MKRLMRSDEQKQKILAETKNEPTRVVAKRHGISHSLIYTWGRKLRKSPKGPKRPMRTIEIPPVIAQSSRLIALLGSNADVIEALRQLGEVRS